MTAVGLALAGCNSDKKAATAESPAARITPSAGQSPPPPAAVKTGGHTAACDLVTQAEAEAVLGAKTERITSTQDTPVGKAESCVYRFKSASGLSLVNVIILATSGGPSLYQSQILAKDKRFVRVGGIGDRADVDETTGLVVVLHGQTIYSIQVVKANKPAGQSVLVPLAKTADGRV